MRYETICCKYKHNILRNINQYTQNKYFIPYKFIYDIPDFCNDCDNNLKIQASYIKKYMEEENKI